MHGCIDGSDGWMDGSDGSDGWIGWMDRMDGSDGSDGWIGWMDAWIIRIGELMRVEWVGLG